MRINQFCKEYFYGFKEASHYKNNTPKENTFAALKIASYFTIVVPMGFLTVLGISSLFNRVKKPQVEKPVEKRIEMQAEKLKPVPEKKNEIIQTIESKTVHNYTGDLTNAEKAAIQLKSQTGGPLEIRFNQHPQVSVEIRKQNLFRSGAEVIVNAANTHLGGGGGIDGAIHDVGGPDYIKGHRALQKQYNGKYVEGHAAIVGSGNLKNNHKIDHVIIVAGPQGQSTPDKDKALYSCYYNSLVLAQQQNKSSIAFPSISTGIFAFPKDRAAAISTKAIHDFLRDYPGTSIKAISIHYMPDAKDEDTLKFYADALA